MALPNPPCRADDDVKPLYKIHYRQSVTIEQGRIFYANFNFFPQKTEPEVYGGFRLAN